MALTGTASRPPGGRSPTVIRAARGLITVNLCVLLVIGLAGGYWRRGLPAAPAFVAVAVAFALVEAVPMRLSFSEHRVDFTLTDAVLAAGLFYLTAPWIGVAAMLGDLSVAALRRYPLIKVGVNAASRAGAGAAAGGAFALLAVGPGPSAANWIPALIAAVCWSSVNAATVSAILARAERRALREILARSLPTALTTSLLAAPLGLLVVELAHEGFLYPLLVVPVSAGAWLSNRHGARQHDEHLRVERLYQATTRTALIAHDLDVMAGLAQEAKRLLTGSAAICIVKDGDLPWVGRTARPTGTDLAREADVLLLAELAADSPATATAISVPEPLRALGQGADTLVLARSPAGSPVDMVLAVLRHGGAEESHRAGVGDTLSAFAAHGAVIAANSLLLAKVQRSLTSQVEANRRKDDFVATISHELRTPLTVMLGTALTLLRLGERVEAQERQRLLRTAADQGERLRLLIEDLLLVAASEQGKVKCDMVDIPVAALAADIVEDVPDDVRQRVVIENDSPEALVRSDRHRIRQMLVNLVGNAGKYAPSGPIHVRLSATDGHVTIAVVDHGPGIPAPDQGRVFERFVQLDQSSTRSQGGAGLGLYVCRQLALQLGIELGLLDTPGGGCTFTLVVPRAFRRRAGDDVANVPTERVEPAFGHGRPTALLRRPVTSGRPDTERPPIS